MIDQAYIAENRLMTLKEAADFLGTTPDTVRGWTNSGLLRCVRLGPRQDRRFRQKDVHGFAKRDKVAS